MNKFDINVLEENYNKLIDMIDDIFSNNEEAINSIKNVYDSFGDQILLATYDQQLNYGLCGCGTWLEYKLEFISTVRSLDKLIKIKNYSNDELYRAAFLCNIGIIGDNELDLCNLPTEDKWKISKGIFYESNPEIDYMTPQQRTLFVLQKNNVCLTKKEYLGILLVNSLNVDADKFYFNNAQFNKDNVDIIQVLAQANLITKLNITKKKD